MDSSFPSLFHYIRHTNPVLAAKFKAGRSPLCTKGDYSRLLLRNTFHIDLTPPPQNSYQHVQLVHTCLFQYKGIRLYSDVTVGNKVEENRTMDSKPRRTDHRTGSKEHYAPRPFFY